LAHQITGSLSLTSHVGRTDDAEGGKFGSRSPVPPRIHRKIVCAFEFAGFGEGAFRRGLFATGGEDAG
jgi:hypothetical protein